MVLAPLSFLRAQQPSRSSSWDQAILTLPDTVDRTFTVNFEWRRGLYFSVHSFPIHDPQHHQQETLYYPPPHYHLFADEYFRVSRGAGTWHLWNRDVHLKTGDKIKIPARAWHWFEGDQSLENPLAVEVYFDKGQPEIEERFFRNILGYLADCHRESLEPSICQLLMFFYHFDMVPGLRFSRWETLNLAINVALMYIATVMGVLMGYKGSYDEYYQVQKKKH
ncbi:hypothetical protein V2A60_003562 [Cordyceps javanica]